MITRRTFLATLAGAAALPTLLGGYAFGLEPRYRLATTLHRVKADRFSALAAMRGRPLRIAAIADIHACEPWMPVSRIDHIVARTNRLDPDLIVLLGDYVAGMRRFRSAIVPMRDWSNALSRLKAPLGAYAILGNHDWWVDGPETRRHIEKAGIPVLENQAVSIDLPGGGSFWLAGLGDQLAIPLAGGGFRGVDDLDGTLDHITDTDRPALLLAHEPDIFPQVPSRIDLTLSGHTHGGQVRLPFVGTPLVPSRYGSRYAYGHIIEDRRQLIVSGGLGCSMLPVRFRVPPEITLIEIS